MGLLDDATFGGFGPWNAFYSSPLQGGDPAAAAAVPLPQPRPPGAGAPQPDSSIPIGDYRMPQFGVAPQAAAYAQPGAMGALPGPASASDGPSLGDRLSASVNTVAHSRGLIPLLVNGISAFGSGQRTDPAGIAENQTLQALQARGVSAADAQAALANPAIMRALIAQAYGAPASTPQTPAVAMPAGRAPPRPAPSAAASPAPSPPPPPALPQRPRVQLQLPQSPLRGVTPGGVRW